MGEARNEEGTEVEEALEEEELEEDAREHEERLARVQEVSGAFSPGAPVTSQDLFAGRIEQMAQLNNLVSQRGMHGALYGERGVGKTSLAAVVSQILTARGHLTVRVSCGAGDSFSVVARRVFSEIVLTTKRAEPGFGDRTRVNTESAEQLLGDDDQITPDRVRHALEIVSKAGPVVVFIDEFDRLVDGDTRAPFADLIKGLSDYVVPATVVLVGVADDVNELVAEHRSVERSIQEILMPRMSMDESLDIVRRGLGAVGMSIEDQPHQRIARLSKGLPHYTHLLAQEAAINAAWNKRNDVVGDDVDTAIESAIDKAQQTVKNDYDQATYSAHASALYAQVLLACALAPKDDLGFFAPVDVREPLSKLVDRKVGIPTYQGHLKAFTTEKRGRVLQRRGEPWRWRYRFTEPLLEPFVLIKGLRDDARKKSG